MDAPSPVEREQLAELHIRTVPKPGAKPQGSGQPQQAPQAE